ncbi:metal ABC transporter solute-binding protein, Zn/Mn family [Psychrobacter sp. SZ93C1]|uniref:metal ABC transporter solute-binding protein, Zn/Mn family n=1 Tax=Psychrobacter sp. SZ93C1 TaxID=2792058 RepID=UPI0018CCF3B9|nr:zinc ABC transporter substrate-binding protein [Psychrobacter sp. SZ93C1]MBH0065735.1 zinc ABC transporter substrate-binding protein [Psychrobacter sp. SZ93C1]
MNSAFNQLLRPIIKIKRLLVSGALLGFLTLNAQAATVSVSNYPMFLLSEAVTEGTPSANRILQPGDVGHHGSVSPSDIKAIKDSKFVVWFGPSLENSLTGSLETAPNAIAMFDFKAFNRYPLRDVKGMPIAGTLDPHIWLDPENAKAITRALAVIHSRANPEYASTYQANVKKFAARMDTAVATIQQASQKNRPYWAYHDAYQYIEKAAHIELAGSLSPDHHISPKASQLRWLNENRPVKQMCMVNQGVVSKGLLAKLQPISTSVQIEDMSDSQDFVKGWTNMAQQINNCVDGK